MQPTISIKIIGILLLLNVCSLFSAGERPAPLPLHGGCVTTAPQYLLFGTTPGTINATAASAGVAGTYLYQWQKSIDSINFVDIAGATSQNLGFSSPLAQTTWFQRKTMSGAEVAYTAKVVVVMASNLYYNVVKSGNFTKNTCGGGSSGTTVTYTVPANSYISTISQSDADAKAQNDVNANGQNYANANGLCYWYSVAKSGSFNKNNCATGGTGSSVTYNVAAGAYNSTISQADADSKAQTDVNNNGQTYANSNGYCTWSSVAKSGTFNKNNCGTGGTGSPVTYNVAAGAYTSTVSQADADNKAQNDVNNNGQTYANNNGYCSYYSAAKSGTFTRNNCGAGYVGSTVTYTVNPATYFSYISQADADAKAQNDVNTNGQNYANNNGTCTSTNVSLYATNWTSTYFTASLTNTATNTTYNFSLTPNTNNAYFGQVPPGTYNVTVYTGGGNALFEWWVFGGYLAGQHTYTRNGVSLSGSGSIEMSDY